MGFWWALLPASEALRVSSTMSCASEMAKARELQFLFTPSGLRCPPRICESSRGCPFDLGARYSRLFLCSRVLAPAIFAVGSALFLSEFSQPSSRSGKGTALSHARAVALARGRRGARPDGIRRVALK